ncbi:transporter substrate-binding domain-containing protein [Desulforhopalus vacuolatus]|uniref:substrate-binding periplasmic protein n=1 Tax=Desulforhopalus vacuolatus TaxID=40414 RepID=UPI001963FA72|nr:transporter substrate-binding domain-containing protein [Desulforhopalus vacuolatus]MBM9521005.1 transporter substrate-binding domain-containing protein [Desulforhopalus vacuolatus]
MTEVYNRLGFDVEIRYLPGYRMFRTANNGDVDGVLFSVADIETSYPNLIPIPTPVFSSQMCAFTKEKSIIINNWDSLQNYQIGYVRGFSLVEKRIENMRTEALDEQENMMRMLASGRIDVAVDTFLTGVFTIQKLGLQGIKATHPPLEYFSSFHYLHKKHADMIPKVEQMLSNMEKEGAIQAIRNRVIKKMLDEK